MGVHKLVIENLIALVTSQQADSVQEAAIRSSNESDRNYLSIHSLTKATDIQSTSLVNFSQVLPPAFKFLYQLSVGDKEMQNELYFSFDLLLESTHPLRSCFNNVERSQCLEYLGLFLAQREELLSKLTFPQVKRVLELSGGKRREYLQFLQKVVIFRGRSLTKNQAMVLKALSDRKEVYVDEISIVQKLSGEKTVNIGLDSTSDSPFQFTVTGVNEENYTEIINKETSNMLETEYYPDLFRLLVLCFDEKNRQSSTIYRNLFSSGSLLSILSCKSNRRRYNLRSSVLCLFTYTYISSCSISATTKAFKGDKHLLTDPIIWGLVDEGCKLLADRSDSYPDHDFSADEYLLQGFSVFVENYFSKCFTQHACNSKNKSAKESSNRLLRVLKDTDSRQCDVKRLVVVLEAAGFDGEEDEDDYEEENPFGDDDGEVNILVEKISSMQDSEDMESKGRHCETTEIEEDSLNHVSQPIKKSIIELHDEMLEAALPDKEAKKQTSQNHSLKNDQDNFERKQSDFAMLNVTRLESVNYNSNLLDNVTAASSISEIPTGKVVHSTNFTRSLSAAASDINLNFRRHLMGLSKDKEIKKLSENEFKEIALCFTYDPSLVGGKRDAAHKPIKQIIEHLQKSWILQKNLTCSESRPILNPATKIFNIQTNATIFTSNLKVNTDPSIFLQLLKILTWILQGPIDELQRCDRQETDTYTKIMKKRNEYQIELNRLGCTFMAMELLLHSEESVVLSSLSLLINLLDGGNKYVQEDLLNNWIQTKYEHLLTIGTKRYSIVYISEYSAKFCSFRKQKNCGSMNKWPKNLE